MHRHLVLAMVVLAAAGCATSSPVQSQATPSPIGTGQPTTGTGQPTTSTGPTLEPPPSGTGGEIEVDITGGAHKGSYLADAAAPCNYEPAQNRFSVSYADNNAPDGFVALDLVLRDAALAKQDESDDFQAQLSVGGASGGISYSLDPRNGAGVGTAFLDTSPFDATLDLTVTAPDGAEIEILVTCGLG